jgi:hypothetical protein
MTGSSGGGGGGLTGNEVPCSELRFEIQLSSPQAAVVQSLSPGVVLDVGIASFNGTQVLQASRNGATVGGMVGGQAARLRECILAGSKFKATVQTINGGQVRVWVEPL